MRKGHFLLSCCALCLWSIVTFSSCDYRLKYNHYISDFVDADTCILTTTHSDLQSQEASSLGLKKESPGIFALILRDSTTRFTDFDDGIEKNRIFLAKIGDVKCPISISRGRTTPRNVVGQINTPEEISITCDHDLMSILRQETSWIGSLFSNSSIISRLSKVATTGIFTRNAPSLVPISPKR